MATTPSTAPLVWIDLEMTGLDPATDSILEVACIITSADLVPLHSGLTIVVSHTAAQLAAANMSDWCLETHTASGLLAEAQSNKDSVPEEYAACTLETYVKHWVPVKGQAMLAGNSVWADRWFLEREGWNGVLEHLHYRIADVSAVKEFARRWAGEELLAKIPVKEGRHRALGDISQLWLLFNSHAGPLPAAKIDSYQPSNNFTPLHPSEPPFPGPLNNSPAQRRSSSHPTATIPCPNGSPFFTTDNHQTWLPQPPPQRPLQASPDLNSHGNDFVLFPTASQSPQQRSSLELAHQAPSLNPRTYLQQATASQGRRNSTHYSSVNTPQNHRVAEIIQATGHSPSLTALNRSSSTQKQFYAYSAPSSSTALPNQQQQQQQQFTRPPVPLFSQSTGNIQNRSQRASLAAVSSSRPLVSQLSDTAMARSVSAPHNGFGAPDMNLFEFNDNNNNMFAYDTSLDLNIGVDSHQTTSSFTSSGDEPTVSPQDIFKDPSPSAPASTAFTNLTSPSWDSPDVNDSFDASPLFTNADGDLAGANKWYTLFPEDNTGSDESPANPPRELSDIPSPAGGSRRRSSSGHSPPLRGSHGKHSSISGVGARRRDRPLPDIRPEDESDPVAAKRVRNTLAARKSRQKKVEKFGELEKKIKDLQEQVDFWKSQAQRASGGQQ
ncbi:MAG: hypothetical protein M1814_001309 [Vezdaea aestivalis]|nr:MAG: hypothetical protein M1814_001309 [Vezdaea aestivalis]